MADRNRSRDRFSPPVLGGSSLLTVFAVLCLTVFALLSLTTVQADTRLADASAQAVKSYYAADCQAQEILARLRAGEIPENVELTAVSPEDADHSGVTYAYTVPMSDTQELQVEVTFAEDGTYTVERWQSVSAAERVTETHPQVWDGELEDDGQGTENVT